MVRLRRNTLLSHTVIFPETANAPSEAPDFHLKSFCGSVLGMLRFGVKPHGQRTGGLQNTASLCPRIFTRVGLTWRMLMLAQAGGGRDCIISDTMAPHT
jgi:hypothetical protein